MCLEFLGFSYLNYAYPAYKTHLTVTHAHFMPQFAVEKFKVNAEKRKTKNKNQEKCKVKISIALRCSNPPNTCIQWENC